MQVDNLLFFSIAEEQLREGQCVKMSLKGTSMLPTLCEEDVLLLEPLVGEPAEGDVLLFRCADNHIVHRFLRRDGEHYIMQGDNNIGTEVVLRSDLLARLVSVERVDGHNVTTDSEEWAQVSRKSLRRKRVKQLVYRWLGRKGRHQLRPWYFILLAILMWAPLNGLGIPLDNYILGLRMDHLLHGSVYLLCPLFLWDIYGRLGFNGQKWAVWATAIVIGMITEGVQYLLPYRGFDVNDLIANVLGVTLGWVALLLVYRRRTNGKQQTIKL